MTLTRTRYIRTSSGSIHKRRPAVSFGLISIRNHIFGKSKQTSQSYCAAEAPSAASLRPTRCLDGSCAARALSQRARRIYISHASTSWPALRPVLRASPWRAEPRPWCRSAGLHRAAAQQPHAVVQQQLAAPPTIVLPLQAARGRPQHCGASVRSLLAAR
jgi:hypothetical protein